MLKFLSIIAYFLIFISKLPGNDLHLIIYFDINKTLIASDQASKKSVKDVLNELLAEKYKYRWDNSLSEDISFESYVKNIITFESDNDQELRHQRLFHIHHFIEYLSERNHPLLPEVLREYDNAINILNNSGSIIFPSFYSLLNYLDNKEISYSIILRSFGEEVFDVKNEINTFHKNIFSQMGEFNKGKLHLEEAETLEGHQTIYNRLRRIGHVAIHDDWHYWMAHKMSAQQGKPFYIHTDDTDTLPIFFDDNIREENSTRNIIAPLDVTTGALIPIDELIKSGQAVRVQALEAILNPDYFIEHINRAIDNRQQKMYPSQIDYEFN